MRTLILELHKKKYDIDMKSENNRDDIIHSGLITIIWYPNIHSRGFNHFGLVSNMEPRCDPAIGHRPYLY